MLQLVLLSVFTTSFAFTTHRYDVYESYGAYRPVAPLTDYMSPTGKSNGRRPVQTYELPRTGDGVESSGVLDGNSEQRRADVQYSYQYPYQRNYRPVPWNRVTVTEPTKYFNFFQNSDQNIKYDTGTSWPVSTQEKDQADNKMNEANKLNKNQGNVHVPEISTQSNDVNRTPAINDQQITWNDDQHSSGDNSNVTTRSIGSANHSNFNSLTPKEATDKIYRLTKTNNTSVNNNKTNEFDVNMNTSDNNKVRNEPNVNLDTVNRFSKDRNDTNEPRYGTKTTQDNEVTPRIEQKTEKGVDEDRWVWGNAGDNIVATTTLVNLDDRAAFTANNCPGGKVKVGQKCVGRD